jgi:5-methylcytosine-specific restriction endonuclease McrA
VPDSLAATRFHQCTKCGVLKPLTDSFFKRLKRRATGFVGHCKACESMYRRAYYRRNRAKAIRYSVQWKQQNRELARVWEAKYRASGAARVNYRQWYARQQGAPVGEPYTREDLAQMYEAQQGRCAYCEKPFNGNYEIDHVVPISRGGPDCLRNLVLACRFCNNSKHNKMGEEFLAMRECKGGLGNAV